MRHVFAHHERALEVASRGKQNVLAKYAKDAFRRTVLARIKEIRATL